MAQPPISTYRAAQFWPQISKGEIPDAQDEEERRAVASRWTVSKHYRATSATLFHSHGSPWANFLPAGKIVVWPAANYDARCRGEKRKKQERTEVRFIKLADRVSARQRFHDRCKRTMQKERRCAVKDDATRAHTWMCPIARSFLELLSVV